MNQENIIITCIAFVVISIVLFLYNGYKASILLNKKKKKYKKSEITEVKYLSLTYGLKKEKLMLPKIILLISIVDAFIISIVFLVVTMLPWAIIWQLLVGFVLLLGLIYSIYGIIGKILVKKGYQE